MSFDFLEKQEEMGNKIESIEIIELTKKQSTEKWAQDCSSFKFAFFYENGDRVHVNIEDTESIIKLLHLFGLEQLNTLLRTRLKHLKWAPNSTHYSLATNHCDDFMFSVLLPKFICYDKTKEYSLRKGAEFSGSVVDDPTKNYKL